MNEDRIIGAGRDLAGKTEWAVGDAVGSNRLQADGVIDRVGGVFQNGYGQARDAAADALHDAPAAINDVVNRGQELSQQVDAAIRRRLGEHGSLYVLAGAVGLLGLGLLAFSQARSPSASATRRPAPKTAKPAAKPRASTTRARKAATA
jgi:uncharacterized protein YjbJ (UPF0337 family)